MNVPNLVRERLRDLSLSQALSLLVPSWYKCTRIFFLCLEDKPDSSVIQRNQDISDVMQGKRLVFSM